MLFYGGATLPDNAYAPLEAQSASFSDPEEVGKFRGGLGMIQVVRYSDTPVGKYYTFSPGIWPNDLLLKL